MRTIRLRIVSPEGEWTICVDVDVDDHAFVRSKYKTPLSGSERLTLDKDNADISAKNIHGLTVEVEQ